MSDDKEGKKEKINQMNQQIDDKKKQLKQIEAKIAKLKAAKKNIEKEIDNLELLQKDTTNLKTNLDTKQFKGSLRDKFDSMVDTLNQKLQTEQNGYQQDLATIELKISKLELQSGDLGTSISNLLSAVVEFTKSLV